MSRSRGIVLDCAQPGNTAPPPVRGILGAYTGSPIHHGGQERGGRLPEPSSPSARFLVDPGLGDRDCLASDVVSYGRSFCHTPQLPAPGILFATKRLHGSGHGHLSPSVGRSSGVCIPTFHAHSTGPEQASDVQGNLFDTHRLVLAMKEWFPELLSLAVAPLVSLPLGRDLLRQLHFHRLRQNLRVLCLHV